MNVKEVLPIDQTEKLEKELEDIKEEILVYDISESGRDGLIELLRRKSICLFKLGRYDG